MVIRIRTVGVHKDSIFLEEIFRVLEGTFKSLKGTLRIDLVRLVNKFKSFVEAVEMMVVKTSLGAVFADSL